MSLRRLLAAVLSLVTLAALAACAVVDPEEEANRLGHELRGMPGVTAVSMEMEYREDSVLRGDVSLEADMVDASAAQIADAASTAIAVFDDRLLEYYATLEVAVGDGAAVRFTSSSDPEVTERVVELTRRIRSMTDQPVTLRNWDQAVTIVDTLESPDPSALFDEILRIAAPLAVEATVRDTRYRVPAVDAVEPITASIKETVDDQVRRMPTVPFKIDIDRRGLSGVVLNLSDDPSLAYQQVVDTVRAADAGPTHPLTLDWVLARPAPPDFDRWKGSAQVGACDSPNKREADRAPEAIAFENRVRAEFDTC